MCGIAGYWEKTTGTMPGKLPAMIRLLKHRGPDDEGYWFWDPTTRTGHAFSGADTVPALRKNLPDINRHPPIPHQLALGHRRYAIIDLSDAGHQPMLQNGLVLVYNGEIYNFQSLREELAALGCVFSTGTDAEVILQAYRQWGKDCFARFRGFFAFALFDTGNNTLLLARDPLGKAPLYLLRQKDAFYFSSDIKPLLEVCPEERTRIRSSAVTGYISSGLRDTGNHTFWENIDSLPSASWLEFNLESGETSSGVYWQIPETRLSTHAISLPSAAATLRTLLQQSLERRLVADRPIGFTLSGGLDSSALAALYAQNPGHPRAPVFTVQYADPKQDETPFAREVIRRYPAHFEHIIINGDARTVADEWDTFLEIQEEPFHDPALFTDFHQQRILKTHGVDININGAGGDELLAGYPAYYLPHIRWLLQQGPRYWTAVAADAGGILENIPVPELWRILKRRVVSNPVPASRFLRTEIKPAFILSGDFSTVLRQRMGEGLMYYWMRSQHKNYMHIPVEPRLPYLDVDLVDFCFTLPPDYLIRGGWTKYILRHALQELLPPTVVWRKRKMGFPFDTAAWLAQQEPALAELLRRDMDNPWIDVPAVLRSFRVLLNRDPQLLWRLVCFSLWHLRFIRRENLIP